MVAAKAIPDCLVGSSVCWQVAPQHHLAYPARQCQHHTNSRAHEGVAHEEETPGCNLTQADCTQTARMDPKTVEYTNLQKHCAYRAKRVTQAIRCMYSLKKQRQRKDCLCLSPGRAEAART